MLTKRQAFYNSDRWQSFTKLLRFDRMDADGTLYCERCGKAIVSAYDCIAHHIEELTEENVDDVSIALNPDNIKLLHFRCHNAEHERFGYGGKRTKQVFIVYGAPCAGKSTWVQDVAGRDDLILDIDKLWTAVKSGSCGEWEKPGALKQNVFGLRDLMLDNIRTRFGQWSNAYVIGGYPMQRERERMQDRLGADKLIFVDTPKEVCMERAKSKGADWRGFVESWFEKYSPPAD